MPTFILTITGTTSDAATGGDAADTYPAENPTTINFFDEDTMNLQNAVGIVTGALLQRAADKDDVAEVIVEFCRTESVTGQTLVIDAGRVFH